MDQIDNPTPLFNKKIFFFSTASSSGCYPRLRRSLIFCLMSESRRSGSAHFTSSLLQAEAFNYISLLASSCRWYKLPQLVSFFLSRAVRKPSVTQLLSAFHLKRWGENHLSIFLPFSCFFVPGPLGVSRNRMEWIFEIGARNRGGLLLDKSVGTLCKKTR